MFHEFLFNDDVTNFMNQTWEKYYDIENPFLSGDASIDQDTVIFNNENTKKSYVAAYAYFMDHFLRELRDKFETYLKLEK